MTDRRDIRLGALMCTASAACYAGLSILGKLALASGLTLTGMLSLRFLGAAAVLAVILVALRQPPFAGRHKLGRLLALGSLLYAPQAALFFTGLTRLPASIAVLLLYVYPVLVAIFDWILNRRLPDRRTVLALIIATVGVALTLYPQPGMVVDPLGASRVGSATGLAVYIVLSEGATQGVGARVGGLWIVLGAGMSFTLAGTATGTLEWQQALAEPLLILGLIVVGTVLPVTLFLAGVARVGPTGASLLSTLEPVFTVALGIVILQETLASLQVVGGAWSGAPSSSQPAIWREAALRPKRVVLLTGRQTGARALIECCSCRAKL
jgi:drug/metabolite transporter (DMT)-like permease